MRILDRYILKNFLVPFLYCFLGFIAIWLAFDLADNTGKIPPRLLLYYYGTQVPFFAVLILPAALLLSLLYSLSRMSRSNEIISMLASGMSLYRLVVPLIISGVLVSGLSFAMDYKLGPHAEVSKRLILDASAFSQQRRWDSLLFRNRADSRTWLLQLNTNVFSPYERAAHPDLTTVRSVHITQQDKEGNILRKYYAHAVSFDAVTKTWILLQGETVDFDADGLQSDAQAWDRLVIRDWSETPVRIFSTYLDAANLSIPELRDYLHYNSDYPESQLAAYRTYYYHLWADPASCIIIVFVAAPLGVVYSRRGVLAGVAGSIFIFFGIMFFDKLFIALGKHGTLPPLFAAWGTDVAFGIVGLILLYMRAGNRDVLSLNPKNLLHLFKQA